MSDAMLASGPARGTLAAWRVAMATTLVLLLVGFASIVWTPYAVTSLDVGAAAQDPSAAHWLGTDQLGRDVLSLVMKGMLTSFVVGAVATAVGALIGIPLGLAAARWRWPAEAAVRGLSAYLTLVPAFVFAVLLAMSVGASAATVMVAAGLAGIPAFAATTRDALRRADRLGYVEMARLAGMPGLDIMRRHTLPGIVRLIGGQAVAQLAAGILAEASLSYIGLGTQPPATSLGLLLHDGQSFAAMRPVAVLAPGLVLLLIVLALGMTSRGVKAMAAPELRAEADDGAA